MAEPQNRQPDVARVLSLGTAAAGITAAQSLDVSKYNYFRFVLGANTLAFTVTNSREGEAREFVLVLVQDTTATRLKPTLAGTSVRDDNVAGSALAFKTVIGTGGGAGALVTLSVAANAIDTFRFYTADGITYVNTLAQLAAIAT